LHHQTYSYGSKRDEETEEWKRLHNEELNDLYCSPNSVRVMKPRMRLTGNVARIWERCGVYRVLVGKPEGKRPLGRPGVCGRIDLQEVGCGVWTGSSLLRIEAGGGHL
jgi:hypothetical protein